MRISFHESGRGGGERERERVADLKNNARPFVFVRRVFVQFYGSVKRFAPRARNNAAFQTPLNRFNLLCYI